jgi:hypothetical protein
MLNIENIKNIEGKEFQLSNGKKYIIAVARAYHDHYSFVVCPLMENGVASISGAIVYTLHKNKKNGKGYQMTSAKLKQDVYVTPVNLKLKNFIFELRIQTAQICSQ